MLPLKQIYIDSRHKTNDSVSDSNFKIELPTVLQMPANTVFFVTDVCIPHVWKTIETDYNDKLYIQTIDNATYQSVNWVVPLAAGTYTNTTLATALQTTLIGSVGSDVFAVVGTSTDNSLSITTQDNTHLFRILTDTEVLGYNWGTIVNTNNLASANDIIKNYATPSKTYNLDNPFKVDFLDLQPINNVYITSPNLGSYHQEGSCNERLRLYDHRPVPEQQRLPRLQQADVKDLGISPERRAGSLRQPTRFARYVLYCI